MYKMVLSDADGTLVNKDLIVSDKNIEAIKKINNKGIRFAIVSGRCPGGIESLINDKSIKYSLVSYSGAYIEDEDGNTIYEKGIPKEIVKEIIEFIEENHFKLTWNIFSFRDWYCKEYNNPDIIWEEKAIKVKPKIGSYKDINVAHKVLCMCDINEVLKIESMMKERFPSLSIVKSSPRYLEIMNSGINKAIALKKIADYYNIKQEETMAFGDNYNDLEMLEASGKAIVMANAPEDIKAKFSDITLDNNQDGFSYMLYKLNII